MGRLAERLGQLTVDASSPDGRITAEVRGPRDLAVRFADGAYRRYSQPALEDQLAGLATRAWARYHREHEEIVDAFLGDAVAATDDRAREFQERLAHLTVHGESAGRAVQVRSRALVRWEFAVRPGSLDELAEHEFVVELRSAVADTIADHRAQVILLTDELYDLGLPGWRRRQGHRAAGDA